MYTMETNNSEKNNPDPITKRDTIQLFIKIFVMILFVTLLFSFVFGFFRVSDGQMSPAFLDGDLLFFTGWIKTMPMETPFCSSETGLSLCAVS